MKVPRSIIFSASRKGREPLLRLEAGTLMSLYKVPASTFRLCRNLVSQMVLDNAEILQTYLNPKVSYVKEAMTIYAKIMLERWMSP